MRVDLANAESEDGNSSNTTKNTSVSACFFGRCTVKRIYIISTISGLFTQDAFLEHTVCKQGVVWHSRAPLQTPRDNCNSHSGIGCIALWLLVGNRSMQEQRVEVARVLGAQPWKGLQPWWSGCGMDQNFQPMNTQRTEPEQEDAQCNFF